MCFTDRSSRDKRYYKEEVIVAPRPVRYSHSSSHSHHHHHNDYKHIPSGHHTGRTSYTTVTRTAPLPQTTTSRAVVFASPNPKYSSSNYRRSVPVVVESRRSALAPKHSTNNYRRSVPVVVESRRSTHYIR